MQKQESKGILFLKKNIKGKGYKNGEMKKLRDLSKKYQDSLDKDMQSKIDVAKWRRRNAE